MGSTSGSERSTPAGGAANQAGAGGAAPFRARGPAKGGPPPVGRREGGGGGRGAPGGGAGRGEGPPPAVGRREGPGAPGARGNFAPPPLRGGGADDPSPPHRVEVEDVVGTVRQPLDVNLVPGGGAV